MERPIVAIVAAGEMGAAIGGRLHRHGVEVRTTLAGRSPATATRAQRNGFAIAADDRALVDGADVVLSVLPPGSAIALAERLQALLAALPRKPIYVDCNAISPPTAERVASVARVAGCAFVDAGIIGAPPHGDDAGPRIYLSGVDAPAVVQLAGFGLDVRDLGARVGAASALKLAYAGVTKGLTAIGAATRAAAETHGVADALRREVLASQPAITDWLDRQVPKMPPKAYRWVDEMEEIAAFLGEEGAGSGIYDGAARFYERIARAFEPVPLG
jgi:3-hydroxyisobutyrate dehydrogenase-like beta-hydroxyacid dehydrogenase